MTTFLACIIYVLMFQYTLLGLTFILFLVRGMILNNPFTLIPFAGMYYTFSYLTIGLRYRKRNIVLGKNKKCEAVVGEWERAKKQLINFAFSSCIKDYRRTRYDVDENNFKSVCNFIVGMDRDYISNRQLHETLSACIRQYYRVKMPRIDSVMLSLIAMLDAATPKDSDIEMPKETIRGLIDVINEYADVIKTMADKEIARINEEKRIKTSMYQEAVNAELDRTTDFLRTVKGEIGE